jgi:hypothetical protein
MYKTDFVVKYHDIENELILNLHRKMMRQHELEDIAEKEAAAAKVAAAILEKENQIKALELLAQKQTLEEQSKSVKKKGGRKKATPVVPAQTVVEVVPAQTVVEVVPSQTVVEVVPSQTVVEAPKKRGRKKAVKVEEPKPEIKVEEIKVEVQKEEPKKTESTVDDDDDDDDCEDIEYTMDDVHLICEKLYRDELLSVFEVETINDPNMDAGIKRVIKKMIDNTKFKQFLDEVKNELIDFSSISGTPTEIDNVRRNAEYVIFITLFSQHVFYITHKCICQLFTVDDVDPNLLDRLKDKTISLFKKN